MRGLHTRFRGAECAARELGALLVMTRTKRVSCSPGARDLPAASARPVAAHGP